MGYSVKWVTEHLGITRDMLRYYEKEQLLPQGGCRNPQNKYRDYSEADLEWIWGIKLLFGVGFTAKEIYRLIHEQDCDFDTAMAQKVIELEKKYEEAAIYLEFAKSVKFMGRIPTATKIGSIRFDDFLMYVRDNWNFYSDPYTAPFMRFSELIAEKEPKEWNSTDVEQLLKMLEAIGEASIKNTYVRHGYFQVIADMCELGYESDTVQRVVRLFHEAVMRDNMEAELDGKITPEFMAESTVPFLLGGDIAAFYESCYGKKGCLFIAQALAYYGGYNLEDLC